MQHGDEMIWDLSAGLGSTDTPHEEGRCFCKRNARHSKSKPMRPSDRETVHCKKYLQQQTALAAAALIIP